MPRYPINTVRVARYLAASCIFAYFFISFLQIHVYNNDFWWHLASGKYITETHSLPHDDPFSYTTNEGLSSREKVILKGYWLAQILFYKVYSLWSFKGIILLRSVLLLFFLLYIFITIKRQKSSDIVALLLTIAVFDIARHSAGERPQLFTFLVFSIMYYLLEDFRLNRSKKIWLVPFVVTLLSNMHPGYIVCLLLVSLYAITQALLHFLKRDHGVYYSGIMISIWVLCFFCRLDKSNRFGER